MFFSIVLMKPVWNLYACNFAHVTSTHAVNVSAHLLWMYFTGCSTIHNSQHQLHERHEQRLPNSWNLYICTCFPTPYNPLVTSLHSRCLPMCLPHMNDFHTCKLNGTMTLERVVSFLWTVAWHVNIVYEILRRINEILDWLPYIFVHQLCVLHRVWPPKRILVCTHKHCCCVPSSS